MQAQISVVSNCGGIDSTSINVLCPAPHTFVYLISQAIVNLYVQVENSSVNLKPVANNVLVIVCSKIHV